MIASLRQHPVMFAVIGAVLCAGVAFHEWQYHQDHPFATGVPGVLIALTISPELALYTVGLFVAIQVAEGYLLQPLVEKKTVALPPALTITMQVMLGALFGLAGVALATPLTAVLAVLVSMLYVQDVLGDNVMTPSELSDQKK